jgi:hypothetical protein
MLQAYKEVSKIQIIVFCQIKRCWSEKRHTTLSSLAKVAIFTTNVDAENQWLINHQCVCGALQPPRLPNPC